MDQILAPGPRADPYYKPSRHQQWQGATSQKFSTQKLHLQPKESQFRKDCNQDRRHFPHRIDEQKPWRSSLKMVPEYYNQNSKERVTGIAKVVQNIKLVKPRAQRLHLQEKKSETIDEFSQTQGIKTFMWHNKKTQNQRNLDNQMGRKTQIGQLSQKRNNLGAVSMGDKAYRVTEHSPDFFKQGGLVTGSSNIRRPKNSSKLNVDFYQNYKMQPPNPNRKLWKDTVRINALTEQQRQVEDLRQWEKNTLKQIDPSYKLQGEDSQDQSAPSKVNDQALPSQPPPQSKGGKAPSKAPAKGKKK